MRFLRFILDLLDNQERKRRERLNRLENMRLRDEVEGYRRFMRELYRQQEQFYGG